MAIINIIISFMVTVNFITIITISLINISIANINSIIIIPAIIPINNILREAALGTVPPTGARQPLSGMHKRRVSQGWKLVQDGL